MTALSRPARLYEVAHERLTWIRCAAEHTWHRHNVSALLRTADAFAVHHVHLIGDHPFQAVRAQARGADRWLDVHHHPDDNHAIAAIRAAGCALWIADLDPDAVPPEDVPLDRPVCVWIGAEVAGVGPAARAAAAGVVTLPMRGMTRSLNLAAAATALLHVLTTRALAAHGAAARLSTTDAARLHASWRHRDAEDLSDDLAQAAAFYQPEATNHPTRVPPSST